ncbi:MAG: ribose-phosphate pyrophosphokinase [Alectoria fallacina]|uniref:Ribose-phosphate pyrophosphokinase n=1 Tax=Alectoria fallacina TaxID=1903189 RepID=A0A8H3I0T6_9LECA|nr:MAG: ribose-phosphate pyrophosphokinase [Alectoria fallacina]
MVRNIVVLGGSSHPSLTETICDQLGLPPGNVLLSKFSVGETRVEIKESVRGKDVYIIQSGSGRVNDNLMELLITLSACKTASARKVTAVLPLFPYSRQSDIPYSKSGAPLSKASNCFNKPNFAYSFESTPATPHPDLPHSAGLVNGIEGLNRDLNKFQLDDAGSQTTRPAKYTTPKRSSTLDSTKSDISTLGAPHEDDASQSSSSSKEIFQARPGYTAWVSQAFSPTNGTGTKVFLLEGALSTAGKKFSATIFSEFANRSSNILAFSSGSSPRASATMDLHDPQYQGFFDIPVDNLYGRPILKRYIQTSIPNYQQAVVVSPDAGGAKRATAIADSLGMPFALIHKERRPTKITDRQNATMMLVGDVANRTAILIDDLADTSNTITRAAKLLKKEGAKKVYALITHGVLSGEAIERINASALDKVIVTNSVPQEEHEKLCPKLEVLDVGHVFAEAIRRVHHGESISVLFQYD